MRNNNLQLNGYLLAILSVFTAANTYFSSKYILQFETVLQFGLLWYGFGLLYNILAITFSNKIKTIFNLNFNSYLILLAFAVLEIIATTSFFTAIKLIDNPAIVSFIGNISPALVVTLSIIFLKEKFNNVQKVGVFIAIAGAFLVSLKWNLNLNSLFINGSQYVLVSVVSISINVIIAKKYIAVIKPELLSFTRIFALFVFSVLFVFILNEKIVFYKNAVYTAMYGAFIGPFVGAYAQYNALRFIEASKVIIIQTSKSFVILLSAFVLLNLWPLWIQVIGGILTVLGAIIVNSGNKFHK